MMRGVTSGGGTAAGASAGGFPLAGKTGTVNDHTDVWFIGYTPTYVTGVWMGNPLRKESLGAGMTGGHGAVPYFNAFMIPFMKDKPRDSFPGPPPMPSDIKALAERNKREELEKLADADLAGKKTGIVFTPGVTLPTDPALTPPDKGWRRQTGRRRYQDRQSGHDRRSARAQRRPPVQPPTTKPRSAVRQARGHTPKRKKGDGVS